MYKYILFFCTLLCAGTALRAQTLPNDIIITMEREQLHVKVLKVGINEVEYLKADNLDGPLHVMAKGDIASIRYANGSMDVFNETADIATPQTKPAVTEAPADETPNTEHAVTPPAPKTQDTPGMQAPQSAQTVQTTAPTAQLPVKEPSVLPVMSSNGYDFYIDGVRISRAEAKERIMFSGFEGMYYWKKSRRNAGWGWTLIALGALDLCSCSIAFSAGENGFWPLVEGLAFIAGASVCLSRVPKARRMAAHAYNLSVQERQRAHIELAPASQGLGLALRF